MKHINLFGPVNSTGYGMIFSNVIKEFLKKDISLYISPIGAIDPNTGLQGVVSNLNNSSLYNSNMPSLQLFHDTHANQFHGKIRGALSQFETTKPFDAKLADTNDLVFTTTEAHKNILKEYINENKIYLLPLGVSSNYDVNKTDKLMATNNFTFFTGGKNESRKNTDKIIKAFVDTMSDKEATLIAHTFNPFPQYKQYPFTRINILNMGYKQIEDNQIAMVFSNGKATIIFTKPGIPEQSLFALYNSANINISCSSGEGWDLVLNEALAMGIPSIISNCLGHGQFIENYEYPELVVNSAIKVIAKDDIWFNGNQGQWDEIDIDDIKSKIIYAYDNSSKYLNKNIKMGIRISQTFNWTNTVDNIIKAFNSIENN